MARVRIGEFSVKLRISTALLLGAALFPTGPMAGNGYVGVYADSTATTPCAAIPPMTGATLFVVASVEGSSAGGITGAEFRIEVSNPQNWFISYYPPPFSVAIGNPVDIQPGNPADGSGLAIGFSSCRTPLSGKVQLGTLSIFNANGAPTNLVVRKHSSPNNTSYSCPLFVLCDNPVYTKLCMSQGSAQSAACSTIASMKSVVAGPSSDDAVFSLNVNNEAPEISSGPFSASIDIGLTEIWVVGRPLHGSTIAAHYDGNRLQLGELSIPFTKPASANGRPLTNEILERAYGGSPRIQELRSQGASLRAAKDQLLVDLQRLHSEAVAAYIAGGQENARAVLEQSPLAENVRSLQEGVFRFKQVGMRREKEFRVKPRVYGGTPPQATSTLEAIQARKIIDELKALERTPGQKLILIDQSGNIRTFGGGLEVAARAQVEHVARGMPIETLPSGPLRPGSGYLEEIRQASSKAEQK